MKMRDSPSICSCGGHSVHWPRQSALRVTMPRSRWCSTRPVVFYHLLLQVVRSKYSLRKPCAKRSVVALELVIKHHWLHLSLKVRTTRLGALQHPYVSDAQDHRFKVRAVSCCSRSWIALLSRTRQSRSRNLSACLLF